MDVDLLVAPTALPRSQPYDLVRTSLAEFGVPASVTTTVIDTDAQVAQRLPQFLQRRHPSHPGCNQARGTFSRHTGLIGWAGVNCG